MRIQNDRHWSTQLSTRLECLATCQLFNPTIRLTLPFLLKKRRQSSLDADRRSQMTKARIPKLAGRTAGPSKQRTTLNDIPPESITYIAQILRSNRPKVGYGCQCEAQKKRIESRARVKGVSNWPAAAWSDPSWAFSAVSKRYRRIVFHEDTTRRYSLGYSKCCIQRVLAIPETIRANIS
jgi:hypothetical protein